MICRPRFESSPLREVSLPAASTPLTLGDGAAPGAASNVTVLAAAPEELAAAAEAVAAIRSSIASSLSRFFAAVASMTSICLSSAAMRSAASSAACLASCSCAAMPAIVGSVALASALEPRGDKVALTTRVASWVSCSRIASYLPNVHARLLKNQHHPLSLQRTCATLVQEPNIFRGGAQYFQMFFLFRVDVRRSCLNCGTC